MNGNIDSSIKLFIKSVLPIFYDGFALVYTLLIVKVVLIKIFDLFSRVHMLEMPKDLKSAHF